MATENELELVDNYLRNRLSGQEKSAFENALESDPSLKKEVEFQQQLIDGIKRERMVELKNSLNNIVVPSSGGTSAVVKVSLFVIAGLVALSIYFGLKEKSADNKVVASEPTQQPASELPKEHPSVVQPSEPSSKTADKKSADKATTKDTAQEKNTSQTSPATQPKLDVFDPSTELETTEPQNNAQNEKEETTAGTIAASSIAVETDNSNKKLNFHYQFKEGKLLLYGSFEKNLYEILEFFSNNKRTVFLFYNSNYYLLNEKQIKPALLKPISDPALLKKLKEYRGN